MRSASSGRERQRPSTTLEDPPGNRKITCAREWEIAW